MSESQLIMSNPKTMSQRSAKAQLGNPSEFEGGCLITRNGVAELFIQTAEERAEELNKIDVDKQAHALLKLTMLAKSDIDNGNVFSQEEALAKIKAQRR